MWFIFLASIVCSAYAIDDLDCAFANGTLTPDAIKCNDKPGMEAFCKTYEGKGGARKAECFSDGTTANKEMKNLMIQNCPKTCGYCCKKPEFDCQDMDPAQSSFDCSKVTDAMCTNDVWKSQLIAYCPKRCGLCAATGDDSCRDLVPGCGDQPAMCTSKTMDDFSKVNCKNHCGYCKPGGATVAPGIATNSPIFLPATQSPGYNSCTDELGDLCIRWKAQGTFCGNPYYKPQWYKCRRTCGLC